jgi:benzoyl-CoA reductase/2-hydroxyglutaryl-CoA dehydratase subunit BcrC/BadD/HgdB
MNLESLIDRVLADPLREARSAGALGGRAVGYIGPDIPVELILAASAIPVRLCGTPAAPTPHAERYLEASFSPESRSIAEQWLTGGLDCFDSVIFSRSDDSAQRLYYYLCELQRRGRCGGPKPLLYDLARIKRALSLAHTIESTRRLAAALNVNEADLDGAVQRVKARLALLSRLTALRAGTPAPQGSLVHRIMRASHCDWSMEFDLALERWLAAPVNAGSTRRVLLVGSAPPDERLHCAVESADAAVVDELNDASAAPLASSLRPASALEEIAQRCYRTIGAIRSLLQSRQDICRRAHELRVQGVIVWLIAEDTGLAWEAPHLERALRDAGVPVLLLTLQPWACEAATLTAVEQFVRTLETVQ